MGSARPSDQARSGVMLLLLQQEKLLEAARSSQQVMDAGLQSAATLGARE